MFTDFYKMNKQKTLFSHNNYNYSNDKTFLSVIHVVYTLWYFNIALYILFSTTFKIIKIVNFYRD